MESLLTSFFENLMKQYHGQDHIHYIQYNGTAKPYQVYDILATRIHPEYTEDAIHWLANYLSHTDEMSYYHIYKTLIKEMYDLWVNPTLEELKAFNIEIGLKPQTYLENMPSFQKEWAEKIYVKIKRVLKKEGYKIALGSEIIEELVSMYDFYCTTDVTFTEWIRPIDVSLIENEALYIVDTDIFIKPISFNHGLIIEYDNQNFSIPKDTLNYYFDHLMVTKRGLSSTTLLEDNNIQFYFYKNMIDYLQQNPCESRNSTLQKLFEDTVNPRLPFIEAVTEYYGEIYINHADLRTEKDILDFVNLAYAMEEVDCEAKTFDRHSILSSLLCHANVKFTTQQLSKMYKRRDPRNTH